MAFMAFNAIMVTVCFWKQDCSSMRFLVSGHSLKFEGSIAAGKRPKIAVVAEKVGSFAASCFSKTHAPLDAMKAFMKLHW